MLSVEVEDSYAEEIDGLISYTKFYSSRSEFLKDSIRKNLIEMAAAGKELRLIRAETEKLAAKVAARGGVKKISVRERDALARKFAREKGLA